MGTRGGVVVTTVGDLEELEGYLDEEGLGRRRFVALATRELTSFALPDPERLNALGARLRPTPNGAESVLDAARRRVLEDLSEAGESAWLFETCSVTDSRTWAHAADGSLVRAGAVSEGVLTTWDAARGAREERLHGSAQARADEEARRATGHDLDELVNEVWRRGG